MLLLREVFVMVNNSSEAMYVSNIKFDFVKYLLPERFFSIQLCTINHTRLCGFQLCMAQFRSHDYLLKHGIACLYRHRFLLKQPPSGKTCWRRNMAEIVDSRNDPYTGDDHAGVDDVPSKVAIVSVRNSITDHGVKCGAEIFLQTKRKVWNFFLK